jgi:hypothetical protein
MRRFTALVVASVLLAGSTTFAQAKPATTAVPRAADGKPDPSGV